MAGSEAHGPRAVRVTPEDVRRLCEFLYRRTGMLFDDNKRYYIDRRLVERIGATKSESFQAYFAVLRSDADHEIEQLINAFTVNETYFNREEHQLRCMTSDLLGNVIRGKRPGESIRIWSIPCSTGEEPYSIAIWLMENWTARRQLQYRDRRLGHRHARAQGRRRGHLRRTCPHAALAGCDWPLFPAGGGRRASDRSGPERFHPIHPGQPDRPVGNGALPRLRHRLLSQRADLFRRFVTPDSGGKPL